MFGDLTQLEGQLISPGALDTLWQIYDRLTAYDDKLQLPPVLAESWDVTPDSNQITLHLRKGVQFHSGREMSSDDIRANISRAQNPKTGVGQKCQSGGCRRSWLRRRRGGPRRRRGWPRAVWGWRRAGREHPRYPLPHPRASGDVYGRSSLARARPDRTRRGSLTLPRPAVCLRHRRVSSCDPPTLPATPPNRKSLLPIQLPVTPGWVAR
ncbi:MAG: hypothetical protein J2P17_19395 [Mycobacterium sp.]|nr:hypothetical protein [Mycobacterium sp.]